MGEYLLFDAETNGFKPDTIWTIVITCLLTRERTSYVGLDEIAEAIDRLSKAKMVVGHYIKGFDLKVIRNLVDVDIPIERAIDTLELSKRFCALPRHGLDYWGSLLDLPKLPRPSFDVFTPYMVEYCERDVDLNVAVFDVLLDILVEREELSNYPVLESYYGERTALMG